jgi:hypothetical protein
MRQHTPGPWRSVLARTLIHIQGRSPVCSISISPPRIPERDLREQAVARAKADARLITAAPDLLNALDGMVRMYCELVESGDAGFWDAEKIEEVIAARAAIQSATGG